MKAKLKVAVLTGGTSSERQISLQSGECVAQGLRDAGFDVVFADIRADDLAVLEDKSIDVFFIALHGEFGEDGRLQQILQEKGLTYTGSSPAASKLAADKLASKKAFVEAGVATAAAVEFTPDADVNQLTEQVRRMADKYVIKPVTHGSSVGTVIVDDAAEVLQMAKKCYSQFGDCMIEEFIDGREITTGILCDLPLPIIEIKPRRDFYNYQAKYIDDDTEYLFDTIADRALVKRTNAAAIKCFDALGCRHFARVDFILGCNKRIYALEVNTIPGFTTHSLLPKAAAKAGYTMSDLCRRIVESALEQCEQTTRG